MRITNQGIDLNQLDINSKKANIGCDKCLKCGKHVNKYYTNTVIHFTNVNGSIKEKLVRVDKYYCVDCKVEWESKLYEVPKLIK